MRVEDAEPKSIDQRPAQQAGARVNTEVGTEGFYRERSASALSSGPVSRNAMPCDRQ